MEIWATPTHPPLCTYTNSSLASCILVQLSDLCNLGFAVHVVSPIHVEGMPVTGGVQGCIAPPKFPYLQKTPPKCCLRAKEVWKIGNFMYFWTKKWLKIQGRVLFCQICILWGKKKPPEFLRSAHIQKIRKRSTFEKFAPSSDENNNNIPHFIALFSKTRFEIWPRFDCQMCGNMKCLKNKNKTCFLD